MWLCVCYWRCGVGFQYYCERFGGLVISVLSNALISHSIFSVYSNGYYILVYIIQYKCTCAWLTRLYLALKALEYLAIFLSFKTLLSLSALLDPVWHVGVVFSVLADEEWLCLYGPCLWGRVPAVLQLLHQTLPSPWVSICTSRELKSEQQSL